MRKNVKRKENESIDERQTVVIKKFKRKNNEKWWNK